MTLLDEIEALQAETAERARSLSDEDLDREADAAQAAARDASAAYDLASARAAALAIERLLRDVERTSGPDERARAERDIGARK